MRVRDFISIAERLKVECDLDDNIPAIVFEPQDIKSLSDDIQSDYELTWERMSHISDRIEEVAHTALDFELYGILREAQSE